MTPSEKARVQECVKELSEILYRNTPSDKCQSFEEIEKTVLLQKNQTDRKTPWTANFLDSNSKQRMNKISLSQNISFSYTLKKHIR